jgi:hypothetical protein
MSKTQNPNKMYIIQHKETREQFVARSGKSSWKQPGHAKNAWNQSMYERTMRKYGIDYIPDGNSYNPNRKRTPLFSEQNVFEVVELKHETLSKLEEAIVLLKHLQGRCGYNENVMINNFLEEYEQ